MKLTSTQKKMLDLFLDMAWLIASEVNSSHRLKKTIAYSHLKVLGHTMKIKFEVKYDQGTFNICITCMSIAQCNRKVLFKVCEDLLYRKQ